MKIKIKLDIITIIKKMAFSMANSAVGLYTSVKPYLDDNKMSHLNVFAFMLFLDSFTMKPVHKMKKFSEKGKGQNGMV